MLTEKEVVSIDPQTKSVRAKDVKTGEEEVHNYDKLVIATGASPAVLPVKGMELGGVFTMRTPEDAVNVRAYVEEENVKKQWWLAQDLLVLKWRKICSRRVFQLQ